MITRHLFTGADRPSTYSDIAERAGITRRQAELAVRAARLNGEPILSKNNGQYLATSDAEALEWCERARSRAIHQLETVQAVQRGVERRSQALTLWEEAA